MEGPLLHLRQAIQPLRLATRRKRRVDELRDGGGERLGRRRCLERLVGDGAYGGGEALLVPGFSAIVEALAQGLTILSGQRVQEVIWEGPGGARTGASGVTVVCQAGPGGEPRRFEADKLVLTVPLGVLKAGSIQFNPPLPAASAVPPPGSAPQSW